MADPLQPFVDAIAPVIRDDQGWVTASIDRFIQQTIVQRYSKDSPLEVVSDVAGTGTPLIALPVAPAGGFGVFDPKYSILRKIEYPVGLTPEEDVREEDWNVYRSPTGYQLQLLAFTPQAGESCRLTWTAAHDPQGTTVPAGDFYAVCDYAASLCLEAMAAKALQFGDSTFGADTVNYRSKSQEYLTLAAKKRKSYFNHFGINENDIAAEDVPAISVGSMHNIMGSAGVDRLIHGRYTR